MEIVAKWILGVCVIAVIGSYEVSGSSIFQLEPVSLSNPENKDLDGRCCDGGSCQKACQPFFRICANVNKHASYGTCTLGSHTTDIMEPGNDLNITFYYNEPWPGSYWLIVEAWHAGNLTGKPSSEERASDRLITRLFTSGPLLVSDTWTPIHVERAGVALELAARATCDEMHHGPDCSQFCEELDNEFGHYRCGEEGTRSCLSGWTGPNCNKPVCKPGCDQEHGFCTEPGECRCTLGWRGDLCDECTKRWLCAHGKCINSTFECVCQDGWEGYFCDQPVCSADCTTQNRGYCAQPGHCKCRPGWGGPSCDQCQSVLGCEHGSCTKAFECNCDPGWTGDLCDTATCNNTECHPQNGYCTRSGECRCKTGYWGPTCSDCFPYPGCVNGWCEKPWECNCDPGWSGMLCDHKHDFCERKEPCANGGTCHDVPGADGDFNCVCGPGYTGRRCEVSIPIVPDIWDVQIGLAERDDILSNHKKDGKLGLADGENLPANNNDAKVGLAEANVQLANQKKD